MTDYGSLDPYGSYNGAHVGDGFDTVWREMNFTGANAPAAEVWIRRGYFKHSFHDDFPGSNAPATVPVPAGAKIKPFGRLVGLNNYPTWYPDWTPTTDWIQLPGVAQIEIQQSANLMGNAGGDGSGGSGGSNGIATCTVTCDNVAWTQVASQFGAYHVKQRGWLWPWRGHRPVGRPGGKVAKNEFYDMTPNAQILVKQGYGTNLVKTFTGLIDTIGPGSIRPDRISIVCRDFGGVLVDGDGFLWNKDPRLKDPVRFIPPDYPGAAKLALSKTHNWIIVEDATDIVRCFLRWAGFKEWDVVNAGVGLKTGLPFDRSGTPMQMINELASQLGYVFFIAEPTEDDLSIGVPVFRKQQALVRSGTTINAHSINSSQMTNMEPTHDNSNDRMVIRTRGAFATRAQGGRPIVGGDMDAEGFVLFTATYYPPWASQMAGVIKHLTYYNMGNGNGGAATLGFQSDWECMVACVLIAVQIKLSRDTATVEIPGNPNFGLDSMTYINADEDTGVQGRLYITGRQSTMLIGGDGSSTSGPSNAAGGASTELLWDMQLSGSLCDDPEWEQLVKDYKTALSGKMIPPPSNLTDWR